MMLLVMQVAVLLCLVTIVACNVAAFLSLRALRRELEADARRRAVWKP